jgi:ABC-2 type transport system ATP-binding protein
MPILEAINLVKHFKSNKEIVKAVNGVNLTLQRGIIFGFLGPNGAGKTTTLRMLTTLMELTSGQVTIVGYDLVKDAAKIRTKIGYVSQKGGLFDTCPGRENLVIQGQLYGMPHKQAQARAQELIDSLELSSFIDRGVRTYSGGQKRRVDLAMGLMHKPELLFLDEPTTGLDPQSRAHFWKELRKVKDTGMTIFVTTHYLDEADVLCDEIAIMDHGTIVARGTPENLKKEVAGDTIILGIEVQENTTLENIIATIKTHDMIREATIKDDKIRFCVESGEMAIPILMPLLCNAGCTIKSLELTRPSLDDVFFKQTGHSLRDTAN